MKSVRLQLPPSRIRPVRALLRWYRRHGRSLPWRRTANPYRILISEVMLQQTQVERVREIYPRFLRRFPSLASLAAAPLPDVVRAWQGMGYNNRAVRLHRLAQAVVAERGGRLPSSVDELERLPGIGPYTARAVACFAFGKRTAAVDTNVRRVLLRWSGLSSNGTEVQELAEQMLPRRGAADWNQALMDLGATICRAVAPLCRRCPVERYCRSAHRIARSRTSREQGAHPEPSREGIPRRIYRGRVVDHLRRTRRGIFVNARDVGCGIKDPFRPGDFRWLVTLLRRLERDGLLELRRRGRILEARLALR